MTTRVECYPDIAKALAGRYTIQAVTDSGEILVGKEIDLPEGTHQVSLNITLYTEPLEGPIQITSGGKKEGFSIGTIQIYPGQTYKHTHFLKITGT